MVDHIKCSQKICCCDQSYTLFSMFYILYPKVSVWHVQLIFLYAHTGSGSGQHVSRYRVSCRIMAFSIILLKKGNIFHWPVIGVICVLSYLFFGEE